ncbi:hypothetical protein ADK74_33005 [Streptomyces decoyicus]|nr:hypothetical protein ADK74_33005 [Streptomyces decoyicus]
MTGWAGASTECMAGVGELAGMAAGWVMGPVWHMGSMGGMGRSRGRRCMGVESWAARMAMAMRG